MQMDSPIMAGVLLCFFGGRIGGVDGNFALKIENADRPPMTGRIHMGAHSDYIPIFFAIPYEMRRIPFRATADSHDSAGSEVVTMPLALHAQNRSAL